MHTSDNWNAAARHQRTQQGFSSLVCGWLSTTTGGRTRYSPMTRNFYAACLGCYNAGRLHGVNIEASSDVDAMQEQVTAFFKPDSELAVHDSEGLGAWGECFDLAGIAELCEFLETCEEAGIPGEIALSYRENVNTDADAREVVSTFEGTIDGSKEDWAEAKAAELGYELGKLERFIDWRAVAREWLMNIAEIKDTDGRIYLFGAT